MPGRNGVAALPATRAPLPARREPLVVVPETLSYELQRADGETVTLAGYVKGPGCPIDVLIAYDEAVADAEDEYPSADERETLRPSRYHARLMRADRILRRGLLQAVIPGLDMDTANLLASDDGPWNAILTELGWWDTAPAETSEATADPEAAAGESAGPSDSPASSDTTASTPSAESPARA